MRRAARLLVAGLLGLAVSGGIAVRARAARRAAQTDRDAELALRDAYAKRAENGERAAALDALAIDHELRAPPSTDRRGIFHAAFTTPAHGLVRELGTSDEPPFITAGGHVAMGASFFDLGDGRPVASNARARQTTVPHAPYRVKLEPVIDGAIVRLRDRRGNLRYRLRHDALVAAVSASSEISFVAVATMDRKLALWDLDWEEAPMAVIDVDEVPASIELALDGTRLVTSDRDHRVRLYDVTLDGAVAALCRSFPEAAACH